MCNGAQLDRLEMSERFPPEAGLESGNTNSLGQP